MPCCVTGACTLCVPQKTAKFFECVMPARVASVLSSLDCYLFRLSTSSANRLIESCWSWITVSRRMPISAPIAAPQAADRAVWSQLASPTTSTTAAQVILLVAVSRAVSPSAARLAASTAKAAFPAALTAASQSLTSARDDGAGSFRKTVE
jgi:hypothetical protein